MLHKSCLMAQNILSNLFSVGPFIGSPSHHKFIHYDSDGKEIRGESIRHFTQDLGRHISRRSTGLKLQRQITGTLNLGNSKISQPDIPTLLKHNILRLDIPMNDPLIMYILKPHHQTSNDKLFS